MSDITILFALEAEEAMLEGNFDAAIKICEHGIKLFPDYISAYSIYLKSLMLSGDIPLSKQVLKEVLRKFPLTYDIEFIKNELDKFPDEPDLENELDSSNIFSSHIIGETSSVVSNNSDAINIDDFNFDVESSIDSSSSVEEAPIERQIEEFKIDDIFDEKPLSDDFFSVSDNSEEVEQSSIDEGTNEDIIDLEAFESSDNLNDESDLNADLEAFETILEDESSTESEDDIIIDSFQAPDFRDESSLETIEQNIRDNDESKLFEAIASIENEDKSDYSFETEIAEVGLEDSIDESFQSPESPAEPSIEVIENSEEAHYETPEAIDNKIEEKAEYTLDQEITDDDEENIEENNEENEYTEEIIENESLANRRSGNLRLINANAFTSKKAELRASNLRVIPGLEFSALKIGESKLSFTNHLSNLPEPPEWGWISNANGENYFRKAGQDEFGEDDIPMAIIYTETMAMIYEQQGAFDSARKVYIKLADEEPDRKEEFLEKAEALA